MNSFKVLVGFMVLLTMLGGIGIVVLGSAGHEVQSLISFLGPVIGVLLLMVREEKHHGEVKDIVNGKDHQQH